MSALLGMRAISIRQPWAWLIVNGYKDIENRTWKTARRGEYLVHASKTLSAASYEVVKKMIERTPEIAHVADLIPPRSELLVGGVVGSVCIDDCVSASLSPWFLNSGYGFVLSQGRPLSFCLCKGKLNFFEPVFEHLDSCG